MHLPRTLTHRETKTESFKIRNQIDKSISYSCIVILFYLSSSTTIRIFLHCSPVSRLLCWDVDSLFPFDNITNSVQTSEENIGNNRCAKNASIQFQVPLWHDRLHTEAGSTVWTTERNRYRAINCFGLTYKDLKSNTSKILVPGLFDPLITAKLSTALKVHYLSIKRICH